MEAKMMTAEEIDDIRRSSNTNIAKALLAHIAYQDARIAALESKYPAEQRAKDVRFLRDKASEVDGGTFAGLDAQSEAYTEASTLLAIASRIEGTIAPAEKSEDAPYYDPNDPDLDLPKPGRVWFNAPAKPEWIPVSERMPHVMQDVLVFEGHKAKGTLRDSRCRVDFVTGKSFETTTVTHWMPLPAAPADREKAEGRG